MVSLASNQPSAFPGLFRCGTGRFSSREGKGTSYEQPRGMAKNLVCSEQRKAKQSLLHFLCPLWEKQGFSKQRAVLSLLLGTRCDTFCSVQGWVWGSLRGSLLLEMCVSIPGRSLKKAKGYLVHKYMYARPCSRKCKRVCTQAFTHMWVCIYMPTYTNLILHLAILFLVLQGDFYVYF